ncbi:UbiD family decarboxylase [Mycobacterium fragae]|uniref:Benzoate transporter n=1 Tax=Mycobacterium fragae TaxID=1260918 RepID=A0A1X1UYS0_9MYCO|nr:UbiD family decarboxylase [Mycobacterium fragae]MCV7401693.1 UbiD family decarboxylase [Mycobacterium fragae]ORV61980.1 benzoate transporter [Mycobacterium fragae]
MTTSTSPPATTNITQPTDQETGPDQRSWLATLEAAGQLRRITASVDWDEEIGAITRANLSLGGPALLFENIIGHENTRCRKLLTSAIGNRRQVQLMLGLPEGTSDAAIVRHLREAFKKPIPPRVVDTGPVKENIIEGDEIDLFQFPAPKWHASDGGRYIDTFCGVVTEDKVTGRDNIGCYRGMIVDRNKIAKLLAPSQGWGVHMQGYKPEPMPVAIVYGWHDVLGFCAGSPFPKDVCEWDMMGALLGRPVDLVACETVPLHVPASAEIVVEGYIDPDPATFVEEGPFGEYPGYHGDAGTAPVLQVTRITHRNDPVLRGTLEGIRPGCFNEDSIVNFARSAITWNVLEGLGIGGITDLWMTEVSNGQNTVVQIHKAYRGHAQQVAAALWGTGGAVWMHKNVTVVEEDIDIRDPVALEWATSYRVNAGLGDIAFYGPTMGSSIDPSTPPEKNNTTKYGAGEWTRVLIDATRTWEFGQRPEWGGRHFPPIDRVDPELESRVAARWEEYGIGIPYLDAEGREMLTMEELSKRLPEV